MLNENITDEFWHTTTPPPPPLPSTACLLHMLRQICRGSYGEAYFFIQFCSKWLRQILLNYNRMILHMIIAALIVTWHAEHFLNP